MRRPGISNAEHTTRDLTSGTSDKSAGFPMNSGSKVGKRTGAVAIADKSVKRN
jgi:hypothetical protein